MLIFTCTLVQLGPLLVLILRLSGSTGAEIPRGAVLLVWSCVVGTMDNVIRPVLIHGRRPADDLILSGVIGGLIAFGMIELFIGPVLLAVSWRLFGLAAGGACQIGQVLAELEALNVSNINSGK